MKKLGKILLMILSYVLVAAIAVALTLFVVMKGGSYSKLEQLEALLLQCYINGADKTKLEDAAAHAMVDALGDNWSYYIPAYEYAAYQEQKKNAYVGIGVTIRYTENGYHIDAVTEGGPAEKAGLLPGDVMIAVDGKSVIGMPVEDGKTLVQGKKGTTVEITVDRAGEQLTFTVKRDTIRTKVAEGEMLPGNIGLVTIKNFNTNCYKESREAVEQLMEQGAVAIIFDVRYNGGGYAEEMVKLLDYLLPEGVLFRSEDYRGHVQTDKSDADCLDIPMAVLVNGYSYSAAEFFAAALMEYDAAAVVGQKTYGKGYSRPPSTSMTAAPLVCPSENTPPRMERILPVWALSRML
jgi:carboxyl-terminal processing protease